VAVLDLTASGLDGVGVCRALRADSGWPRSRWSSCRSRTGLPTVPPPTPPGADAYLAKPYSPLALLDVVQRLSRG